MKKSVFQRLAVILLGVCFAIGTLGATYHDCNREMPPEQKQAMAGMDCHQSEATKNEKKCCIDLSCPKCFSSPVTVSKFHTVEPRMAWIAPLPAAGDDLSSLTPWAPDRPPKA